MRVLVLDPFHGAAGDMITGALLGCGADRTLVARAMRSLVAEPEFSDVIRAGIHAVKVGTRAEQRSRTLGEVLERVRGGDAPADAIAMAIRVFGRMAAAEREVHGEHAHFHDVGADDAVADVAGACTALHSLRVDAVAVLPVMLGGGTELGSHGTFPVPPPAVAAILKGSGLVIRFGTPEDGELCTPTGAALLAEFATIPAHGIGEAAVTAVGYGAGTRDTPLVPNVLRAMLVETVGEAGLSGDQVDILETNVDDVSGELLASAIASLMACGARDASAIPCVMKKGRAGHLVRVICAPEKSRELARVMARELGTLGIRCLPSVHRFIAERSVENVGVEILGIVREMPVKCGWMDGKCYTVKAEFDPALSWAEELGVPVREVTRIIEDAAWERFTQKRAGN
jgi:uncharacterized protein (TIGR00299 family) protein